MVEKGDIFEALCREFGEIIQVKALEDEKDEAVSVEFVKGGHTSVATKDNIWGEWETGI